MRLKSATQIPSFKKIFISVVWVPVNYLCIWCCWGPRRVHQIPVTGVTDSCEPAWGGGNWTQVLYRSSPCIFIFLFLILMPHLMIKQIMLAISPLLARVPPSGNGLSSVAYLTPHRRYVPPRLHLTAGLPKHATFRDHKFPSPAGTRSVDLALSTKHNLELHGKSLGVGLSVGDCHN